MGSKAYLSNFLKLGCLSNSSSISAIEQKIDLGLSIYKNNTVSEKYLHLVDGKQKVVVSENGGYNLTVYDINNSVLSNYSFNLVFDYDGPVEKDINYSNISYISRDISFQMNYSEKMGRIELKENDSILYNKTLQFCNNDGVCNGSESYLSCWTDCKSYAQDGICINKLDDGCDLDCAEGIDPNCYTAKLVKGWNLASLPLTPKNKTLPTLLKSIESSYIKLFAYNSSSTSQWKMYVPNNASISNLNEIGETTGFWIKMLSNATLTIESITQTTTNFTLKKGWNLIGYPSNTTKLINETLKNVETNLTAVFSYVDGNWLSYAPNKPFYFNTLKNMTPGYGYWVKVSNDVNWSFNGTFS